jgi:hypothetical protein
MHARHRNRGGREIASSDAGIERVTLAAMLHGDAAYLREDQFRAMPVSRAGVQIPC